MSDPNQIIEAAVPSSQKEDAADVVGNIPFVPIPKWKRVLDVTFILLVLPLLVPIGVILFVFVKIVSPGPAFFRQQRIGHMRRKFMCLKFRTMKVNADTTVHQEHLKELMAANRPTTKLEVTGDKRLIFGGIWLRSAGLDELPQLFNVLLGDMSLVGPRPCTPFEFELFTDRYKQRCAAPPGLTGLWQVSGKNKTTFEEMVDLDLKYVQKMSLWMDLQVIAMTIPAILILIWEMKIQPRLFKKPAEKVLKTNSERSEKTTAPLTGTVPARE